jgi:hypothetical protein
MSHVRPLQINAGHLISSFVSLAPSYHLYYYREREREREIEHQPWRKLGGWKKGLLTYHAPSKKEDDPDKADVIEKVDRSGGGDCIDHGKDDRNPVVDEQPTDHQQKGEEQKSKRVATLDAFRGLTIVVSID